MTEQAYTPPDTNIEEDDPEDEEIELDPEVYPCWCEDDEQRRAFIIEHLAPVACEVSADAFMKLCGRVDEFLKTGAGEAGKKATLAVVEKK